MTKESLLVPPGKDIKLADFDPGSTGHFKDKSETEAKLSKDLLRLAELQDVLYAQNGYALLILFQGMDTAGKDGAIKHVMSGVNPEGVQVFSFKQPSVEELNHDFLWHYWKDFPARGRIGIFNRSYYEEVLVLRVHSEVLAAEHLPAALTGKEIWKHRYDDINAMERYLARNGTVVLKFFLNLSKQEQKRRLLDRIDTPEKNWKYSSADLKERAFWDQYRTAYEEMLNHTSTEWAPWYVIPADHKWFTRGAVAHFIISTLESLKLSYPKVSKEQKAALRQAKKLLQKK
ncbi:MAG: polyphosphate kinase 2 family protein [Terriglobia bacterium]